MNHDSPHEHNVDVLPLLSKIAGFIFETGNPLAHAQEIVRQTAISQKADISTLFLVEQDMLTLKGGVAFLGEKVIHLPVDIHGYKLDWTAGEAEDIPKMGLTAYVAVTNRKLGINTLTELEAHPAHTAKWDPHIYPNGRSDEKTGFGCLYAVPIQRSEHGNPKNCVLGVFKIERRKEKPPFTEQDKSIFDLVAAHLSLLLQTYYRAQNRVFSDVTHAIGGGLGRSYSILTMCQDILEHPKSNDETIAYLRENLPNATTMLDRAIKRLNAVLDVARDPSAYIKKTLSDLWTSVRGEVELKYGKNTLHVEFTVDDPLAPNDLLKLNSLQYLDLSSILGNLLDNAVRHSKSSAPVRLRILLKESKGGVSLVFEVSDSGLGIQPEKLEILRGTSGVYQLPGVSESRGTGLRRVFGLTELNKWKVDTTHENGTCFKITTPDFRA